MPTDNGYNVSQLVADAMLEELLDSTPIPEIAGNIGEEEWGQKTYAIGRTIEVNKVNFFIANQGMTASDASLEEDVEPITVQEPINVMLPYNSYDEVLTIGGPDDDPKINIGWKKRILIPMVRSLRAKLEKLVMDELERTYYMTAGTAGTPMSAASNFGPLTALKSYMEIPETTDYMITSPTNYQLMGSGLSGQSGVWDPAYADPILRELNIPNVFGYGMMKSNYVKKHIYGTAVSDSLTVYEDMVSGARTLVITGATPGHTIEKGDKFLIQGVNAVTPTGKIDYDEPMGFTAYQDAVADGSGHILVTVSVPIYDDSSTRQNVTMMPQSGATVTFKATNSGGTYHHTSNFALISNSLTLSSLKMPAIKGADNAWSSDEKSQMIIRVVDQGVVQTSVNRFRVDIGPVIKAFADYGIAYLT